MIVTEPPSRPDSDFPALPKAALSRFLKRAQRSAGLDGQVTVLLADDTRLKALNRSFRGKNKPTDVLSFPAGKNGEGVVGDLAISVETAQRQAGEHGHTLEDELRILLLHGVLHLAGYDHETDRGEMRALEAEMRAHLKLPVGLIERTLAPSAGKTAAIKNAPKKVLKTPSRPQKAAAAPKKAAAKAKPRKAIAQKRSRGTR